MELQKSLLQNIGQCLASAGETVAVAESVTAGFLQFSFSQIDDSSNIFKGGLTVYDKTQKEKVMKLGQDRITGEELVSGEIAEEMALKISEIFDTDWGIGITGYSQPSEFSDFKTFAYFSFAYKGEIILTKILELHPRTEAVNAQLYYTEFLLGCLKCELNKIALQTHVG
ncbi:CinA family protein [Chryseobacterium caseinilyticum]|uniref:Nicotinamide-nucleotide amidohydrolase family protein n=1 Tax=Chryseobacterium caseinilyticum TaxID=2771428 RepID=A0ABR8ZFV9_9FLAO|nr:nicotinamide-nucleotide amidohydrolase family protein [Chryseobacterium caseinilyticum]MBD8084183.1 nicotinamide-nucleotide amidohydrolase family protein [Chryseobacterium caseinilyticum]